MPFNARYQTLRRQALSMPDVVEAPHFHFGSFRVNRKIFMTVPPGEEVVHLFVPEMVRSSELQSPRQWLEPLQWGGKVVGLRATLALAPPNAVQALMVQAYESKRSKSAPRTTTSVAKKTKASSTPGTTKPKPAPKKAIASVGKKTKPSATKKRSR